MIQVAMSADCAKHQQSAWHGHERSCDLWCLGFCSGIFRSVVDSQGVVILNTQEQEQCVAWMTAPVLKADQKSLCTIQLSKCEVKWSDGSAAKRMSANVARRHILLKPGHLHAS